MLLALVLAANLTFDFPAVHIGVAEYAEGPTGATVFYFPKTAKVAVDVRGGAPGSINTDTLRLAYDEPYVDAITIGGGSSYGLSVATGAAQELKARGANAGEWGSIATVSGAIIFDLGGRRFNTLVPDSELGRTAIRDARPNVFPLGARGAARFAMQGGYYGDPVRHYSGQGGAFRQIGPTKIAVFTVVNSLGTIVDRNGAIVRCPSPPCGTIAERLAARAESLRSATTTVDLAADDRRPTEATTITVVITNQKLPFWALQRLAVQVHTSMARAIQPFHTTRDGDVLFAASTDEIENDKLSVADLGLVAGEVAWDAVLASVPELDPADERPAIELDEAALDAHVGRYEFAPNAIATVTREGRQLYLQIGKDNIYFGEANQRIALDPVSPNEFRARSARRDRVRIDGNGLTVNPGHWPLKAKRVSARLSS